MRTRLEFPLKSLLALTLIGGVPGILAAQEQESSDDRQAQTADQAVTDQDENKDNRSRNGQQQQAQQKQGQQKQGQQKESQEQRQQQEEQQEQARTVKAFDLEHVRPQEMLTAIQTISARQHQAKMSQQAKEQSHGRRNVAQPPQRTQVGFRPATGVAQQDRLAVAVDDQSKTLFVRGTEDQVSAVEKLIEAFDTEAGNLEKQELEGVTLVPVRHENLQRINTILGQLQLQTQTLRVGETAFLILPDDEDQAAQVEKVIEKLKESSDSGQNDEPARSEN